MTTSTRRQGEAAQVTALPRVRDRAAPTGDRRQAPRQGVRQGADPIRRPGQQPPQAAPPHPAGSARPAHPVRPTGPARPARPARPRRAYPQTPPASAPGPHPAASGIRGERRHHGERLEQTKRTAGSLGTAPRPPFVFLVVGLLSGGLICLLLLNTVLAAGTFQMASLQQANATLARKQQELQQQIAYAQSPSAIAQGAKKLGMVPVSQPRFVNLNSGRIYGQAPGPARRTGN